MRHTTYLTTALTVAALVACDEPEDPPALAGEYPAAEELAPGFLPDAPSPEIRQAVREAALEVHEGEATFYADALDRERTASGELLDQDDLVAAHRAFPFGTRLRVTNVRNDRSVEVRVIDRGPFAQGAGGDTILDLSRAAAERLDFIQEGRARIRVEVLEWGDGLRSS